MNCHPTPSKINKPKMAIHSNPIKLTQQNLKYIRRAHIHKQPNWILQ